MTAKANPNANANASQNWNSNQNANQTSSANANSARSLRSAVMSLATPGSAREPVQFSGELELSTIYARDLEFGNSSFLLLIDLTGIGGVERRSGIRYVLPTQETSVLPMAAHQVMEFTFPMTTGPEAGFEKMRTGVGRLVMNVDLETGAVTSIASTLRAE